MGAATALQETALKANCLPAQVIAFLKDFLINAKSSQRHGPRCAGICPSLKLLFANLSDACLYFYGIVFIVIADCAEDGGAAEAPAVDNPPGAGEAPTEIGQAPSEGGQAPTSDGSSGGSPSSPGLLSLLFIVQG